jgi:hypothetical protein
MLAITDDDAIYCDSETSECCTATMKRKPIIKLGNDGELLQDRPDFQAPIEVISLFQTRVISESRPENVQFSRSDLQLLKISFSIVFICFVLSGEYEILNLIFGDAVCFPCLFVSGIDLAAVWVVKTLLGKLSERNRRFGQSRKRNWDETQADTQIGR